MTIRSESVIHLHRRPPEARRPAWQRYGLTLAICAAPVLLAWPLYGRIDAANLVMLFLLAVVAVAATQGRREAVLAAFLSVALFDFLFVPPRFSFAVNDVQYVLTFAVMLLVALIIGTLTAMLRARAHEAQRRADEEAGLYGLARRLAGTLNAAQAVAAVNDYVHERFGARVQVWLANHKSGVSELLAVAPMAEPAAASAARSMPAGPRAATADTNAVTATELAAVRSVYERGTRIDARELGQDDGERLLLRLEGSTRPRGVMMVAAEAPQGAGAAALLPALPSQAPALLGAVASMLATVVERHHYIEVAAQTEMAARSERLRSGILAALSHDVRTPLTALYGTADALASDPTLGNDEARETAMQLRDQAQRLSHMVQNLLDMAKLQTGAITLRCEWQPLEEVVGAAIRFCASSLGLRRVSVQLDAALPLLSIDAVLMERVLCNLLENAAKYSPANSTIDLVAFADAEDVQILVRNDGEGFPPARLKEVFLLFERGEAESSVAGMGVGLAICRAIVEAHGGRIVAENPAVGGAQVRITLPRGEPPAFVPEPGDDAALVQDGGHTP